MASQRLINDIKQLNSQGYSESEIRNMLLKRGYDQVKVDEALDAVFYRNQQRGREENSGGGRSWLKILIVLVVGVSLLVGGLMFVNNSWRRDEVIIPQPINLYTRGTINCSGNRLNAVIESENFKDVNASNVNIFVYNTSDSVVAKVEGVDLSDEKWTTSGEVGETTITGLSSNLTANEFYQIVMRFGRTEHGLALGRCYAK